MTNVCFYFQVHQPFRLGKYNVFDIGKNQNYFDDAKNQQVMEKVAKKCYLPMNQVILDLVNKHKGDFKASYSITGTALEQFEKYTPEVLESFKALAETGHVEFLNETYYHSLSFLFDKKEFVDQVNMHKAMVKKYFGQTPAVFRNTELVYNNELASFIEKLGYKAILAEGWEHYLGHRSPNYVYRPKDSQMRLLLKNYKLSDDIAFRFSNKGWPGWPLTAEKFVQWSAPMLGDSINLFMDYETFGEHQWEDTGIFNFMKALPEQLMQKDISFHTPSELVDIDAKDEVDIHHPLSWADMERDLSAWLGNEMQHSAAQQLYRIKEAVFNHGDPKLIDVWRKLTTSDHLYYMCTKYFSDGDVHKYFNPYDSPYEGFMAFMNVLQDLALRVNAEPVESTKQWVKVN